VTKGAKSIIWGFVSFSVIIGINTPVGVASASPLDNPSCDAVNYSWVGANWTTSDNQVYGVRAPVFMRQDGELCTNSEDDDFESPWISVEQEKGEGITQIGFDHDWDSMGNEHFCRFWAIGDGVPHDYDCGDTPDRTTVYFEITTYSADDNIYYSVEDCGTGGDFSDCTQKSGSQLAYVNNNSEADSNQETDHSCASHMLGSYEIPVLSGNDEWGTVGNDGSSWDGRDWTILSSDDNDCSDDYEAGVSGDIIDTWDSRNTT